MDFLKIGLQYDILEMTNKKTKFGTAVMITVSNEDFKGYVFLPKTVKMSDDDLTNYNENIGSNFFKFVFKGRDEQRYIFDII